MGLIIIHSQIKIMTHFYLNTESYAYDTPHGIHF